MGNWPDNPEKVNHWVGSGAFDFILDSPPLNAPANSSGAGYFRVNLQVFGDNIKATYQYVNQYTKPMRDGIANTYNNVVAYSQETIDGVECVYKAIKRAIDIAPDMIKQVTGQTLGAIVAGILPGLLIAAGVLALTSVAGATVGALLGAFSSLGVGAAPGAAVGAAAGFELGVQMLTWFGLAMLIGSIGAGLKQVGDLLIAGVQTAWGARKYGEPKRNSLISQAAGTIAMSSAVFFQVLLIGIVTYLLPKGAKSLKTAAEWVAAEQRMATLLIQMRSSRFGAGLATWLENNWKGLITNPKTNPNLKPAQGGSTVPKPSPPPPKPQGKPAAPKQPAAPKKPAAQEQPAGQPKQPMSNAAKGVFGEAKADQYMTQKGYIKMNGQPVKVGDKPKGTGIDGVYRNAHPPPEYVIADAKYGSSKLGNTKDGQQMSQKWIDNRLNKEVGKAEADRIRDAMLEGWVERWVLKVDAAGNVTKVILK